jgi:large repetitive protein
VSALSIRQAGRLAAGAVSFVAFVVGCAEGTNSPDSPDPGASGSAAGGTETGGAGASTAGTMSPPTAGTSSTAGSATAGSGGKPTTGGMGGTGGSAGAGGSTGGAGGKAGGGAGGSMGGVGGSTGGVGGSTGGAGGKAGGGAGGVGGTAGSVGSGGMAGMAGTGGASSTGFRYAKLVATSEQNGNVWSAVAELQIMTTAGVALSRTNWTVTADSQETDDQTAPATAAIDGDTATFWHTAWEPSPNNVNDPPLPHSLIVDLKTTQPITGFSYLPRQSVANGRIKDWQFFVSKDGIAWGTAVDTGTFPNVATLQTVVF